MDADKLLWVLVRTANSIAESQYGRYFVMKGGSVLMTRLMEIGRNDLARKTSDLDIHCNSIEVWNSFCRDVLTILNCNPYGIQYVIKKRRSNPKEQFTSDSIIFAVTHDGISFNIKFDMNILSNTIITVEFSPTLNMTVYSELTMISDKVSAVYSQAIFRRIKDLYDLCVFASVGNYRLGDIRKHLKMKHSNKEFKYMLTAENMPMLEHAYEKYKGIRNKPDFTTVITVVMNFAQPIFNVDVPDETYWVGGVLQWQHG